MAALVTTPDVNEFLDKLSLSSGDSVNLEEFIVEGNNDRIISVSDLESKESSLLRVIGVKKGKGKGYILNPSNDTQIEKGDKIFVLGKKEDTIVLRTEFGLV